MDTKSTIREDAGEFSSVRHDLRNVLTALQHGCTLVLARLGDGGDDDIRAFLHEMLRRIENGEILIERLRRFERSVEVPAATVSSGSPRQTGA